jgi:hypothetical protein
MKQKTKAIFGLWVAGMLLTGGAGTGLAAEESALKVSGFVDTVLTLADQSQNAKNMDPSSVCFDSNGNANNCTKDKTGVTGEVDFEYTKGPVVARMDLDIPSIGNEAQGLSPVGDIGIEQAKFDYTVPGGEPAGLVLTGGAFNAPIGFEAQDAPDLYQTSNGQLWNMVPSNIAGFMVSGAAGPVSGSVYFGNEWRANNAEENSVGALVSVAPVEVASLSVGYLTSPKHAAGGDGDTLDAVAQLKGTVAPMLDGLLVFEYLHNDNNNGWAVVANAMHNTDMFPHGLTVRYDSVDCGNHSAYCGGIGATSDSTPHTLTVAGTVNLAENLSTWLEWKRSDPDVSGVDPTDLLTLEFIALLY